MKIEIVSEQVICSNRDSVNSYFGWPSVARLRDGRLAMVASGFRTWHLCPFGKGIISFSEDEGEHWSIPSVWLDTPLDDRDCGITAFGESSVICTSVSPTADDSFDDFKNRLNRAGEINLHRYAAAYLELVREKKDWKKYVGVPCRISHDNARSFGEIFYLPVTSPHGPTLLPDGDLLFVGCQYERGGRIDWRKMKSYRVHPDGTYEHLCDIAETDDGVFPPDNYEPHAIVTSSGRIIVHVRKGDPLCLYQCESEDGGKSFTKPHPIGLKPGDGAPAHLIEQDGRLISVYSHRESGNYQIRAAFSEDDGETWDINNVVTTCREPQCDFGYPASVVRKDGSILTVYYGTDEGRSGRSINEEDVSVIRQVVWRYE